MARFSVPKSPKRNAIILNNFVGADFTNDPSSVSQYQVTECENMIRDVPGKMRKCMGYHVLQKYNGKINGFHKFTANEGVLHAGTCLYWHDDIIYFNLANEKSRSWKCGDNLMIVDGKELIAFDGTDAVPASEIAYVPTVTISKNPSGGGTSYEDLNLIQPGFTELFLGTANDTDYRLTFANLDKKVPLVYVMDQNGAWQEQEYGVDFDVDYDSGVIEFTTAPGVSPISGEDNVKITAYRTVEGYADRINKCTIGAQYGINGNKDRLFLSGNPEYLNYDWFCQQNDPTYWPDLNYSVIGSHRSKIMGYSILNNYLATHKDEAEEDQTIVLRAGELSNDRVIFKVVNSLQAESAIAVDSFAYLKTEPVFLTRQGIHAVTTPDSGEKYSQNRSFYLDGKLLDEPNLEDAVCCVHNDMYWLCLNGVAYILDGLQQLRTDASEPYSTRQYAGFYRTNLPARTIWTDDNSIYFGTENGEVCAFYTDKYNEESYYDNGVEVKAYFITPDFSGNAFYRNKTFRYLAVRLENLATSSCKIEALKNGVWVTIKDGDWAATKLIFSQTDFGEFSFVPYKAQRILASKMRLKKLDSTKFRISNVKAEPFEVYDIGLEFTENNNIK
jgi:hypothetical protein